MREKSGIVFFWKIELTFFSVGIGFHRTQNHKNDNAMMVMLMLFFPFLLAGFIFLVSVLFIWKSNHEFFSTLPFFSLYFLSARIIIMCVFVCVRRNLSNMMTITNDHHIFFVVVVVGYYYSRLYWPSYTWETW